MSVAAKVKQVNRWRDQFNPLRSLTFPRAVGLLEAFQRGEYADVEWTYSFIERRDPDLIALIERRIGALREMDWDIKTIDNRPEQAALAKTQAETLRAAYERLDNLYEAIEHIAMATFRGFSMIQFQSGEKAAAPGQATHAECLDHWSLLRNGSSGDWYWNAESRVTTAATLDQSDVIDLDYCLVREARRPIDEIALIKFVRQNLSQKDWDAFIEIYGLPGWIVIMPPTVPTGKEEEYRQSAQDVTDGGSGALPAGSTVQCSDAPRGVNPFRDHLQFLTEKLVLAGTGGLLTMLTQSGSGTLAGSAHMEAFKTLARSEARTISELFQRHFDKAVLDPNDEGIQCLAYFEIAANEETDIGEILDHALKITQAGGQPDWAELSEQTGYHITPGTVPAAPGPAFSPQSSAFSLANRTSRDPAAAEAIMAKARKSLASAQQADLAPLARRLAALIAVEDGDLPSALQRMLDDLPTILTQINAAPETGPVFEKALREALTTGIQAP